MNPYLKNSQSGKFLDFCDGKGIKLSSMQQVFAIALYSLGSGAGKSFLIQLLHKFEASKH